MSKSIHGESKHQNGNSEVPESVQRATNELKLYGGKKVPFSSCAPRVWASGAP